MYERFIQTDSIWQWTKVSFLQEKKKNYFNDRPHLFLKILNYYENKQQRLTSVEEQKNKIKISTCFLKQTLEKYITKKKIKIKK